MRQNQNIETKSRHNDKPPDSETKSRFWDKNLDSETKSRFWHKNPDSETESRLWHKFRLWDIISDIETEIHILREKFHLDAFDKDK